MFEKPLAQHDPIRMLGFLQVFMDLIPQFSRIILSWIGYMQLFDYSPLRELVRSKHKGLVPRVTLPSQNVIQSVTDKPFTRGLDGGR